jgi:NADH-quinone oxidoreductase subunit A
MGSEALVVFFLTGVFFVVIATLIPVMFAPKSYNIQKLDPWECGIEPTGDAWIQFRVGYYLFAIIYLIFDVEIVFLVPWATVMKEVGTVAFVEALIFLVILGLGLIYAWKKRALVWD